MFLNMDTYGTVCYLRFEDVNSNIHCSSVMAKSRVVLKKATIPRLELSAALVATRWYENEIVAWILRYRANLHKAVIRAKVKTNINIDPSSQDARPLDLDEMRQAEKEILKYVQGRGFQEEIARLNCADLQSDQIEKVSRGTINKSSPIYKLDPQLKEELLSRRTFVECSNLRRKKTPCNYSKEQYDFYLDYCKILSSQWDTVVWNTFCL